MSNILLCILMVILIFSYALALCAVSCLRKITKIQSERINDHSDTIISLFDDLIETNKAIIKTNEIVETLIDKSLEENDESQCEG